MNKHGNDTIERDPAHKDPITDAAGAHPVGLGVGAAVCGAAIGWGTAAAAGAVAGLSYDCDDAPSYRLGGSAHGHHRGKSLDEVESQLAADWNSVDGSSAMSWDDARPATEVGWNRIRD